MKRLFAALLAIVILATPQMAGASDPLAGLIGQKRVLLLFARSRSDANLDRQLDLLSEQRTEITERRLVVISVAGNSDGVPAIGYASLASGSGRQLQKRFMPAVFGLTVVLIGLDGAEQGRWQHSIEPKIIFDLIYREPLPDSKAPAVVN